MQLFKRQPKRADQAVVRLVAQIRARFAEFVSEYNDAIDEPSLRFAIEEHEAASRLLISNSYWVLSFRVEDDWVKAHVFRTTELLTAAKQENSLNQKMALRVTQNEVRLDNETVIDGELDVLLLSLFETVVRRSQSTAGISKAPNTVHDKGSVATAVRQLIHERNSLLNDLLTQNEAIHSNIAREIHDQIISDLLLLKKRQAERNAPEDETETLEDVVAGLRDICSGLSSRDLKDWGLKACLQNLVRKMQRKSEAKITLQVIDEPPEFAFDIALQAFRIVQEALNNSLKHSGGDAIEVVAKQDGDAYCFVVSDNGAYKNERRSKDGGSGMYIMSERAALINMHTTAHLTVTNAEPRGTSVSLRIATR